MSNVGKVCDYLDYLRSLYICAFSNDWLIKMWPWRLLTKCFRACVWGNDISYNTYITVFWSGSMRRLSWHTWLRCRSSVRIEQRCRDLPLTTRTAALQRRERWTDGQLRQLCRFAASRGSNGSGSGSAEQSVCNVICELTGGQRKRLGKPNK